MTITLNGQSTQIPVHCTVFMLLESMFSTNIPTGVAVSINYSVVRKSDWNAYTIEENDEVEVLWASSGG
jgi:sulfur carrier protein